MNISTTELRRQPGAILARVERGSVYTVTFRGSPIARLIQLPANGAKKAVSDSGLFGLWKNRLNPDPVEDAIRTLRVGRGF